MLTAEKANGYWINPGGFQLADPVIDFFTITHVTLERLDS
jgi:hypothetical protein